MMSEEFKNNLLPEVNENGNHFAQFFTPSKIAQFMASLFKFNGSITQIRILDPGAGEGILSNSVINRIIDEKIIVNEIELVAIEADSTLLKKLEHNYNLTKIECKKAGINFNFKILNEDFIEYGFHEKNNSLFGKESDLGLFDYIITNPPYRKISSSSTTRKYLNSLEIESTNIYTAFLSIASLFFKEDGQLVAITPRSFCNGTYFKKFRHSFFSHLYFHRIHIYNKRNSAFNKDNVLQENIIFLVKKLRPTDNYVQITTSETPEDELFKTIKVDYNLIIFPQDKNKIIHIINDEYALKIVERIYLLRSSITDIDINVSTGKVVDFRVKDHLADISEENIAPLYFPLHFNNGSLIWPKNTYKRKEAIYINDKTKDNLITSGYYVFCKRFSPKEEKEEYLLLFIIMSQMSSN